VTVAYPRPETDEERKLEDLFPVWITMPAEDRIYINLARRAGIQLGPLVKHAQKFLWAERLREVNARVESLNLTVIEQTRAKIVMTQLATIKRIQDKAIAALDNTILEGKDAARLLIETIKLQREILGMNETRHQDADDAFRKQKLEEMKKETLSGPVLPVKEAEFQLDPALAAEPLEDPQNVEADGNPE